MRKSIRNKLFIYIFSFIVGVFGVVYMLNITALPAYYRWQKSQIAIEQATVVNNYNVTDYTEYYDALERIAKNQNTEIVVYNLVNSTGSTPIYEASLKFYDNQIEKAADSQLAEMPEPPVPIVEADKADKGGKTQGELKRWWQQSRIKLLAVTEEERRAGFFYEQQDKKTNIDSLIYQKQLDNGDIVAVRIILGAIDDSIRITNTFLFFIGLAFIGLAFIVTYYFAKNFTQPIIDMQKVSERMSKLDFSELVPVKTDDELGTLSRSINFLSTKLSESLTDLQDKNAQLMVELQKERQLDTLRRMFVSNASHELRTPLTIIESYAEGLALGLADDTATRVEYANIIIDEVNHMTELIDNILDLSQIETGVLKLNQSEFYLIAFISGIVEKYQVLAKEAQHEIILVNNTHNEHVIIADKMRIQQVLRNYLANALTHAIVDTPIIVRILDNATTIRVEIANEGVKLDAAELKNIWTEFYKNDVSRERSQKQYGLGLAIVSGVIALHHGADYGAYTDEKGMVFWFSLPYSEN